MNDSNTRPHPVARDGLIDRRPLLVAVLFGLLGMLVSGLGAWIPGAWRDEAATGWVVQHSYEEMATLAERWDLVLLLYYRIAKWWVGLWGFSIPVLRGLSVLAVGIGSSFMLDLGRRLGGTRMAATCGLAFLLLPRVLWSAVEARPYALVQTVVAILLWIAAALARGGKRTIWLCAPYLVGCIVAVHLHLHAALTIAWVFVGVVFLPGMKGKRIAWLGTHVVAGLSCLGLVMEASKQSFQVQWITTNPPFDSRFEQVLVDAYFPYRTAAQYMSTFQGFVRPFAWVLAVLCVALIVKMLAARAATAHLLALGAIPVVGFPTVLLVVGTISGQSLFMDRYFCAASPCFALLLGAALEHALPWMRRAKVIVVVMFVSVALLAVQQRTVLAKSELDDHAMIAHVIAENAEPGDGYLFGKAYDGDEYADSVDSGRLVLATYPEPFRPLYDVARHGEKESLGAPIPLDAYIDLASVDRSMRLWVIDVKDDPTPDDVPDQLAWHGWCPQQHHDIVTHTVELWTTACS